MIKIPAVTWLPVLACSLFALFGSCKSNEGGIPLPFLGVCTSVDHLEELDRHGYAFIQPAVGDFLQPTEPDRVFELFLENLPDTGVEVLACNGFLPASLKAVGPEANHQGILDYAKVIFKRAQMASVDIIVFGSGESREVPAGFDRATARSQFVDLCTKLAELAGRYDVIICLENLNSGETNFVNTVKEAASIAADVNHPAFRILADFYHMLREGEPASHIVEAKDYVYHCDIAEKDERTPPGTKGDDFRPYLSALAEIGYAGGIAIEGRWNNFQTQLPMALQTIKSQYGDATPSKDRSVI